VEGSEADGDGWVVRWGVAGGSRSWGLESNRVDRSEVWCRTTMYESVGVRLGADMSWLGTRLLRRQVCGAGSAGADFVGRCGRA